MNRRHETQNSAAQDRLTTACELLDSALRLYFEGNANFSVLHLAGAAEELLGKHLRERGFAPFIDQLQTVMMGAWNTLVQEDPSAAERSTLTPAIIAEFINRAKNHVKHSIQPTFFDARTEACAILARAALNYSHLLRTGFPLPEPSELLQRFEQKDFVDLLCSEK
jgi:DNA-binding MurR/RpiR family transcriptional regulator